MNEGAPRTKNENSPLIYFIVFVVVVDARTFVNIGLGYSSLKKGGGRCVSSSSRGRRTKQKWK